MLEQQEVGVVAARNLTNRAESHNGKGSNPVCLGVTDGALDLDEAREQCWDEGAGSDRKVNELERRGRGTLGNSSRQGT